MDCRQCICSHVIQMDSSWLLFRFQSTMLWMVWYYYICDCTSFVISTIESTEWLRRCQHVQSTTSKVSRLQAFNTINYLLPMRLIQWDHPMYPFLIRWMARSCISMPIPLSLIITVMLHNTLNDIRAIRFSFLIGIICPKYKLCNILSSSIRITEAGAVCNGGPTQYVLYKMSKCIDWKQCVCIDTKQDNTFPAPTP